MTDGAMNPSQFQILREDLAAMRTEWNQRFDNLVTRETFTDERRRVDGRFLDEGRRADERFANLGKEVAEVASGLAQESATRQTERADQLKAQVNLNNDREKERRARMWQWLLTGVSLVVGPVLGALIATAMRVGG